MPALTKSHKYFTIVILVLVVSAACVAIGIGVGRHKASPFVSPAPGPGAVQPASSNDVSNTSVAAAVSYTLPAGWTNIACAAPIIFVAPGGMTADCQNPSLAPVQISIDANNTTSCTQLQSKTNQGIRDHTCKSLYIDGYKSLQALTEYTADSSYKADTTLSDYYVSTPHGVVKFEYTYTSSNSLQAGFEQLAYSAKVKT